MKRARLWAYVGCQLHPDERAMLQRLMEQDGMRAGTLVREAI